MSRCILSFYWRRVCQGVDSYASFSSQFRNFVIGPYSVLSSTNEICAVMAENNEQEKDVERYIEDDTSEEG